MSRGQGHQGRHLWGPGFICKVGLRGLPRIPVHLSINPRTLAIQGPASPYENTAPRPLRVHTRSEPHHPNLTPSSVHVCAEGCESLEISQQAALPGDMLHLIETSGDTLPGPSGSQPRTHIKIFWTCWQYTDNQAPFPETLVLLV